MWDFGTRQMAYQDVNRHFRVPASARVRARGKVAVSTSEEQQPLSEYRYRPREDIGLLIQVVGAVRAAAEGRPELGSHLEQVVRLLVEAAEKVAETFDAESREDKKNKRRAG